MDIKELSSEEELKILEEGLHSKFWEVFSARFQHMAFTMMGAALGEKTTNRDWTAGKANGMREAMQYPAKRMRDLKTKIEQAKKSKLAL
jgi:hypothetical protein